MESNETDVITYPIPPRHIKFTRRLKWPEPHGRCWYCGKQLKGRQRHYCGKAHSKEYYNMYDWDIIRAETYKRFKGLCQDCGTQTYFRQGETDDMSLWAEIDHIEAIALGGDYIARENLTLYCHKCHNKKTKEVDYAKIYPKQKNPNALKPIKPLLEFFIHE